MQRGDLTIDEMPQGGDGRANSLQFTASDCLYAVDCDGDGRRNLVKSTPDTIASANFLKNLGWKRGEPWLEVRHDRAETAVESGRRGHPQHLFAMDGVGRTFRAACTGR